MWKVFKKHKKKWTKVEEQKLLQLLDGLVEDLEKDEDEEDEEDEDKECSCSIAELMKKGCQCGGV